MFYQIRDDYVNIMSEDYAKEKCFFEDLTEGRSAWEGWLTRSSRIRSFAAFARIRTTTD